MRFRRRFSFCSVERGIIRGVNSSAAGCIASPPELLFASAPMPLVVPSYFPARRRRPSMIPWNK